MKWLKQLFCRHRWTKVKQDGNWLVDMKKEGNGETPTTDVPADSVPAVE